jgi:hypothetical protein
MLKDQEKIIDEKEININDLKNEIKLKEEQLELLMKYKKEKTPEEVKNENDNKNKDIFNSKVNIFPVNEIFNIDVLENKILNNDQINFKIQEALKDILFIPSNANMSITKEYLIDMNFKTELIKTECFSNYLREINYVNFLKMFSNLINNCSFKDLVGKVSLIKNNYESIFYDANRIIKENNLLKKRIKELNLCVTKTREEEAGYKVLYQAIDSETNEDVVVYQALYGDNKVYVRPLEMFLSKVDKEKYPNVTQEYRLERELPLNVKDSIEFKELVSELAHIDRFGDMDLPILEDYVLKHYYL